MSYQPTHHANPSYAPLMNEDDVTPHYAPPAGPPSNTAYMAAPAPQYPPPREGSVSPNPTLYGPGGLDRQISRTPSPTPSEVEALNSNHLFNFKGRLAKKDKKYTYMFYALIAVLLVATILVAVFQEKIVAWLRPAAQWIHDLKAGFLIPIAFLIILSFPPLFGHDIIALLVGLVWGPWVGFAIVTVGQILGESLAFVVFRYGCVQRSNNFEKKDIPYAAFAQVVRDGGWIVATVARYSFIPPHFTTVMFASVRMPFVNYLIAAALSAPKELATVYAGYVFGETEGGTSEKKSKVIFALITVATVVITMMAMRFLRARIALAKVEVIHERRKARQHASLYQGQGKSGDFGSRTDTVFNPSATSFQPKEPAEIHTLPV